MKEAEPSQLLDEATVTARLKRLAELSAAAPTLVALVDMSAQAVTDRLLACAEISALALELTAAGEADRSRSTTS